VDMVETERGIWHDGFPAGNGVSEV
jgi:hypothetical protein